MEVSERTTEPDGTIKSQLAHCPFNHDHVAGEAAVFQYPDGKLGFHCFHSSCADKHWKDFRRHFEPESKALPRLVKVQAAPVELPPAAAPYRPPPLELLPLHSQDYVHAAAESLNVDVSFILLPLVSALGSAIGNSRSILLKRGFIQPPVIWTGIIGRSGSRKSPGLEFGCFAVMERERALIRQNKQEAERYTEELARWDGKKRPDRGAKPEPPQHLTCLMDDLTLAALADAIQVNPRGVLVRKDELSQWFASFDQFTKVRGADVSQWLSLHTGVLFGLDRRTDRRCYRTFQPRVNIAGGIQPAVLKRILTVDFFERGLPARFLFAYPPFIQDKWSEATVPDNLRAAELELFQELCLLAPVYDDHEQQCPKLLRLDADAKAVFVEFYNECGAASREASEQEEAAWCKLTGYAARLALVGQLAHNPQAEVVTGEVMAAACDLARWFGNEAARIYATFSETPEQREQRKLVEFIESRAGIVTVRDLTHYYWPLKNQTEKAEQALTQLVKAGRGTWEQARPEGPGRPTRKFQLLRASPSPKFINSPGKTGNYGDGDEPRSQKNEGSAEPDAEAVSHEVDTMPEGILEL